MLMAQALGHEAFWHGGVVAHGIHPITRRECASSTLEDKEAARLFLEQDRSLPTLLLNGPAPENLLNMAI
ncbi:KU80 protein [Trypanosoma grayi]|uniref:KU80 protein n=1 Tax=Trypanosoma grayi TaxID=71804 RepID=UPI0004F466DB|nr:KU80 protein [Trypanosoma grayi]KEG09323.1 KU80 protein [Trypanosoma grayi]